MFFILPSVLHSLPTQFDLNMRYKFVFNIMQLEFAEFFSFARYSNSQSSVSFICPFARNNTRKRKNLHIVWSKLGIFTCSHCLF